MTKKPKIPMQRVAAGKGDDWCTFTLMFTTADRMSPTPAAFMPAGMQASKSKQSDLAM
jgi:hypothetical protein